MGISLGLVGLGAFGSTFAPLFKAHPLVERVALCDREPERIARFAADPRFLDKFDPADQYQSLEEICKADLDALVIITQPWLHAPQAVQALESGKHVYSAVPIVQLPDGSEILDWCDKLVETCRRTGLHYMLGETTCYRPQTVYCRRRAAEGAFGRFTCGEGQYLHDIDSPGSNLRKVQQHRLASQAGREWLKILKSYTDRGIRSGPMHYPTHSTSGPVRVMGAHMTKVSAWGMASDDPRDHELFGDSFINETALFRMSNGATVRICEHRKIGHPGAESFSVYGTEGCFVGNTWFTRDGGTAVTEEQMREPLPDEVYRAFRQAMLGPEAAASSSDAAFYKDRDFQAEQADKKVYGGHGGSHAYLVHEFVDAVANDRHPAINAWEAVRYMAPGVMAHKSAERDGELLDVPDWGDAPT